MTEADDVARRHAFHPLRVKRDRQETVDTRSFVLDVPPDLAEPTATDRGSSAPSGCGSAATSCFRCYSMSSAPDTDPDLTVTVKRVPGGTVSNWFNDSVSVGDSGRHVPARRVPSACGRTMTARSSPSAGGAASPRSCRWPSPHCRRPGGRSGSSTPTGTRVRSSSTTFLSELESRARRASAVAARRLGERVPRPRRLLEAFAGDDSTPSIFVCGPGPFMELVEGTLLGAGVDPGGHPHRAVRDPATPAGRRPRRGRHRRPGAGDDRAAAPGSPSRGRLPRG